MSESLVEPESVPAPRIVAVTGASSFLGSELIRLLDLDPSVERIIALDIRRPPLTADKVEYHMVDLTQPTVDGDLARILGRERVDTLVHAAFLSHPTHATEWAHELEDVGTMHVLNACAELNLAQFVLCSTTMVYGAAPNNPNFLSEDHELRGQRGSRFVNDKVRAEKQVARFRDENPSVRVTVLRFAPLLGPTVSNFFTRFFARPIAPVMMGYDPLMQFVHERDAVTALALVIRRRVAGVYNIVAPGVLPYSTVRALLGRLPVPIPHFIARPLSRALWVTQIFESPPSFLDRLRFLCVASGDRASRELGFVPKHDIRRTLADFLDYGDGDGAIDIQRSYG